MVPPSTGTSCPMVSTFIAGIGMLKLRITRMAASAGDGCIRACCGVSVFKGVGLIESNVSITACICGVIVGPQAGFGPLGCIRSYWLLSTSSSSLSHENINPNNKQNNTATYIRVVKPTEVLNFFFSIQFLNFCKYYFLSV